MDIGGIIKRAEAILEPLLEQEGLALVDCAFVREQGGWVLRVFIDKGEGISIEDCARVSREFGDLLDVEDIIPIPYRLEVSSPGLDRPLKKEADFVRFSGKRVRIKTRDPVAGRRNFRGLLVGCGGNGVQVEVDGEVFVIPLGAILKANLEPDFNRL